MGLLKFYLIFRIRCYLEIHAIVRQTIFKFQASTIIPLYFHGRFKGAWIKSDRRELRRLKNIPFPSSLRRVSLAYFQNFPPRRFDGTLIERFMSKHCLWFKRKAFLHVFCEGMGKRKSRIFWSLPFRRSHKDLRHDKTKVFPVIRRYCPKRKNNF